MADASQDESRPARMLVIALVALGLLARLTPALMMRPEQAARLPGARAYLRLARSLTDGEGFVLASGAPGDRPGPAYVARRMPGYPVLVWAAGRVAGAPGRATLILQALCGAGVMAVAAWMAHRLAGAWAAVVAAALLAFDPYQVACSALVAPAVPLALALTAAGAAGVGWFRAVRTGRPAWPWAVGGGLATAAAVYLEVWALALVPVALVAAAVGRRRRRLLAGWALASAVVLAALAPWLVRNTVRLGVPVLTTDLGRRLYEGTGPGEEAETPPAPSDEVGTGVFYLERGAARMTEAPGRWLGRAAARAGRLWSPTLPRGLRDGPLHAAAGYTSLVPTALLAAVGLWMFRRRPSVRFLLLVPLAATVAHGMLAGWAGDRVAVMPHLAVIGGAGLAALLGRRSAEASGAGNGHA